MTQSLASPYRRAALKGVLSQGVVAFAIAVIVFVGWGALAALSALSGGVIAVLPNLIFAVYAFRYVGASKANQVHKSFKRGAGLKFLLTALLFIVAFKTLQVEPLWLFVSFISVTVVSWFTSIFFNH
ncbi:ATP synthase subunit I [Pseudoalteromonas xiamenensis]|uniref:ATP synthase subunit I n=1 Tax=Pseudoalteromonas xiamenensis TaxID=882626 RepID=A0A975DEK0_9GAMM|nr:ATP synthase subunit I [Pseudoalteromonas xiamenensis]QTH70353.1 ATP synthase subunit I [Pseudoalteromonas xiamenensis]WMN58618.1 ATP synthase subunit I [Pseudoalteromonas xiamenensis]